MTAGQRVAGGDDEIQATLGRLAPQAMRIRDAFFGVRYALGHAGEAFRQLDQAQRECHRNLMQHMQEEREQRRAECDRDYFAWLVEHLAKRGRTQT